MFIVTRTTFDDILNKLSSEKYLGLDTETTGLYPFHGDRMFSCILSDAEEEYYFNFKKYEGLPDDMVLGSEHKSALKVKLFLDPKKYWFIHKGIFDLPIMDVESLAPTAGTIHCTVTGERVMYNEHNDYSLDGCGSRRKVRKDATVENYIKKHKLYTMVDMNGFKVKYKRYDLVPFPIMTKYGCRDARIVYKIGMDQIEKINARAVKMPTGRKTVRDSDCKRRFIESKCEEQELTETIALRLWNTLMRRCGFPRANLKGSPDKTSYYLVSYSRKSLRVRKLSGSLHQKVTHLLQSHALKNSTTLPRQRSYDTRRQSLR